MLRWAARILSGILLLLFTVFTVAEGLPGPSSLSAAEILMFLAVITMLAGLVLAFWRESFGCICIFGGYVCFSLIDKQFHITDPFAAFPIVGLLYVGAWLGSSK